MMIITLSGCMFVKEKHVFPPYPILPKVDKPKLKNVSVDEMKPYMKVAEYIKELAEKKGLTEEEKNEVNRLFEEAKVNSIQGFLKWKYNINAYIDKGRKDDATIDAYNNHAKKKNDYLYKILGNR